MARSYNEIKFRIFEFFPLLLLLFISLNGSSERLVESIVLMKKFPNAKVIFAGGSGSIKDTKLTHSDSAKIFYKNLEFLYL